MKVKKLRERLFFPFLFSIFIPPQEITSKRRRSFRIREQKISQVKQASGEELNDKIIEKSRQRLREEKIPFSLGDHQLDLSVVDRCLSVSVSVFGFGFGLLFLRSSSSSSRGSGSVLFFLLLLLALRHLGVSSFLLD